jgi:hypothetical protein
VPLALVALELDVCLLEQADTRMTLNRTAQMDENERRALAHALLLSDSGGLVVGRGPGRKRIVRPPLLPSERESGAGVHHRSPPGVDG